MPKQSALGVLPLPPQCLLGRGVGEGGVGLLVREPTSSLSSWAQGFVEVDPADREDMC